MKIKTSGYLNARTLVLLLLVATLIVWSAPPAAHAAPPTNSMGTVMTSRLNVRAAPGTGSQIITVVTGGHVFPVVGRNADASWWQLLLNPEGATGWVHGAYLNVAYRQGVPVVPEGTQQRQLSPPFATNSMGTVKTFALNVRTTPSTRGRILTVITRGEVFPVVGRNTQGSWWQLLLSPQGATGWVHAAYLNVAFEQGVPIRFPGDGVGQQPPRPAGGYGHYWTTVVDVNIHSGPGAAHGIVGGLFGGMAANAVGRNSSSTWIQIRTDNGLGWITRAALPSYANVSVLPVTA